MNTIETKLKELDRIGYIEGSNEEMLIAALREAVDEFQMIRCTNFSPEQIAERALTNIEKILNGGK